MAEDPRDWQQETKLVRGGMARSPYGEISEAIFLSDTVIVMGAHPGRILETVPIDLPRPRTYDVIGSPAFGAIRTHLWRLIETEPAGDQAMAIAPEL